MSLSHEDVLEILALLDASGFDELRLETERYKLLLRRPGAPPSPPPAPASPATAASVPPLVHAGGAESARQAGLVDVVSPMVGVFYRAPKPGEKPFVEAGSVVEETTVVGIVEVMKLMNSISAGRRGTVAEIVAGDGELVQYGSVLVRLAPSPPEV